MKSIFNLLIAIMLPAAILNAQDKMPISISIFSNSSALPGNGLPGELHAPIHPGFTIGTYKALNKSEKHKLYQTFKLGYFYHRYVQHGVQLYSEFSYLYSMKNGFGLGAQAGGGYLHSFPDQQKFDLKDGIYKKEFPWGRPQFMVSFAPQIVYDFEKACGCRSKIFISYQIWFQLPFVRQYVPVLPNSALHMGTIFYLNKGGKSNE